MMLAGLLCSKLAMHPFTLVSRVILGSAPGQQLQGQGQRPPLGLGEKPAGMLQLSLFHSELGLQHACMCQECLVLCGPAVGQAWSSHAASHASGT